MFCPNCGKQNPEGASFCSGCGSKLAQPQAQPQPQPQAQPQPQPQPQPRPQVQPQVQPQPQVQRPVAYAPVTETRRRSKAPIIITLVVALLVIAAAVALLILKPWETSGKSDGKTDSEKDETIEGSDVAEDAVTAFIKLDVDGIMDLFPDEFYEALGQQIEMSAKEAREFFVDSLEDAMTDPGYDPDDIKIKITVTGEDSYKKSELEDIQDAYAEIDTDVKEAKLVLLDVTLTAEGEKKKLEDIEVPLVKVGRKWYLDAYNVEDFTDQIADQLD